MNTKRGNAAAGSSRSRKSKKSKKFRNVAPTPLEIVEGVRNALNSSPTLMSSCSLIMTNYIRPIETSTLQYWTGVAVNQAVLPNVATNLLAVIDSNQDRFIIGGNHRTFVSSRLFSDVRVYVLTIECEATDLILKAIANELKGYESGRPETSIISQALALRDHLSAIILPEKPLHPKSIIGSGGVPSFPEYMKIQFGCIFQSRRVSTP